MGRKWLLLLLIAAMPASIAVGQAEFFTNEADFKAAVAKAGLKLVGCEDMEGGNVQPRTVCTLNNPLETGVPNTPTGCGYPQGLTLVDQRLAPTGEPPNDKMIALGAGIIGNPSTVVGPNTFAEELDMHFDKPPEELAVSMKVFTNGAQVKLDCYDAGNNLIGTGTVAAGGQGTFAAFVSTTVIDRIHVADTGGRGELVDDVCIYTGDGGENCDGRNPARVKAKCKSGGKKVIAKLKKAAPNTDVTFEIDGGDKIDKTTNNRGKAKGKFKRQAPGNHTVTVCDLKAKCSP